MSYQREYANVRSLVSHLSQSKILLNWIWHFGHSEWAALSIWAAWLRIESACYWFQSEQSFLFASIFYRPNSSNVNLENNFDKHLATGLSKKKIRDWEERETKKWSSFFICGTLPPKIYIEEMKNVLTYPNNYLWINSNWILYRWIFVFSFMIRSRVFSHKLI